MTHKFANNAKSITVNDKEQPVLYKVTFNSGYYYIHKGKELEASCERFLYDVFRGTLPPKEGKSAPIISEDYKNVIEYCKKYPQINAVTVQLLFNGNPTDLLKKEKKFYNEGKKDKLCLNNYDKYPYTPEWMIRHKHVDRCDKCVSDGIISGKKTKFVFCPMCGKSIKK